MKLPSLMHILALIAIAANLWAIVNAVKSKRRAVHLRTAAMDEFQKTKVVSKDPRYQFFGSTAKIIRTDTFGPIQGIFSKKIDFSLAIYAINEIGEHFVFKASTTDPTVVKHLQPAVARAILKELYAPPSANLTEVE